MATHSSIIAWRIPWTEEPGELRSRGLQSRTWLSDSHTHTHTHTHTSEGIKSENNIKKAMVAATVERTRSFVLPARRSRAGGQRPQPCLGAGWSLCLQPHDQEARKGPACPQLLQL